MGILKIENRTENWKTAYVFAPLFRDAGGRNRLAERLLGKPVESKVSLELFWFGMRDYVHEYPEAGDTDGLSERYDRLFPGLREQAARFGQFNRLAGRHYAVADKEKLASNILHTEIDIVLESQRHLFVGEAKHEADFGADGRNVLVHQLVRQYVTAAILLDLKGSRKRIVPFVVGEDRDRLRRIGQVEFMIAQEWMSRGNVLGWDDVRGLAGA